MWIQCLFFSFFIQRRTRVFSNKDGERRNFKGETWERRLCLYNINTFKYGSMVILQYAYFAFVYACVCGMCLWVCGWEWDYEENHWWKKGYFWNSMIIGFLKGTYFNYVTVTAAWQWICFATASLASVPITLYANICKLLNISDASYKYMQVVYCILSNIL